MEMTDRRGRIAVTALVGTALLAGALALLVSHQVHAEDDNPLKTMLDKTELKYKKLDDNSWIIPFDAKDDKSLDVYVTYNDDKRKFALIFSTVVDKEDKYNFDKDVLLEAMKLNNDFPGVKFCADVDHGDIDVQSEVLMSTVTPEVLSMYINLVAQMADDNAKKLNELVR
jgi:hypothetical protein